MPEEAIIKNGYDMIYLAACALHGRTPEKNTVEAMELCEVYKLARRHSMQAVCYMALEKYLSEYDVKDSVDSALIAEWSVEKARAVQKNVLFNAERAKLCAFMEEQGIWYMPLKGAVLQKCYPKLGMRQMCDNDILFDVAYRKRLYDHMLECGYKASKYNTEYPDTYYKPPFYCFEMHFSLYTDEKKHSAFYEYYRDVKNRLIKDDGNSFGYRFTDEDFYVFCTAHAYKHFSGAGNGVRSLMDVYVYLSKNSDRLDVEYISAELERLGIKSFEYITSRIAYKIFSDRCIDLNDTSDILSDDEKEILGFYLGSGTYGTSKNSVIRRLGQMSKNGKMTFFAKVKYCFARLFPDMDYYKINHPFVYKHKAVIPVFLIYRAAKRLTVKRRSFWSEIKTLRKMK